MAFILNKCQGKYSKLRRAKPRLQKSLLSKISVWIKTTVLAISLHPFWPKEFKHLCFYLHLDSSPHWLRCCVFQRCIWVAAYFSSLFISLHICGGGCVLETDAINSLRYAVSCQLNAANLKFALGKEWTYEYINELADFFCLVLSLREDRKKAHASLRTQIFGAKCIQIRACKDGGKYLQKQLKKVCCQAVLPCKPLLRLKGSVLWKIDLLKSFYLLSLLCRHFEIHPKNVCLKS